MLFALQLVLVLASNISSRKIITQSLNLKSSSSNIIISSSNNNDDSSLY